MSVVLGSPTPGRFAPPTVGASFPKLPARYDNGAGTVIAPGGALDRWFAYRQTGATVRRDVIVFGDSTTFGAGGLYSWLQRLRDDLNGAGLADGGKGIFAGGEDSIVYDSPEINGIVSNNFLAISDSFDNLQGGYFRDNGTTAGHTVTFQFKGTAFRLWYTARLSGEITYTVDGGSAVTVDTFENGLTGGDQEPRFAYVEGLAEATHTVVVTNRGGRTALPPASILVSQNGLGSGTFGAGTYYYVAVNVFAGGLTVASPVGSITNGGTRSHSIQVDNIGQDSVRIYRSTSSGGPFEYVAGATETVHIPTGIIMVDTGTAVSSGVVPPTTGTTNLNTSAKEAFVAFAPLRATGVALQKHAISGNTMDTFIGDAETGKYWTAFGLHDPGAGNRALAASYTVNTSLPSAGRVKPVLAILDLGFNDLSADGPGAAAKVTKGVGYFAACCQAAGCDGLVLSGQLPYNANWPTYGSATFAALRDTALAKGLAFADHFTPIGGPSLSYAGGTNNPHLTKTEYQTQADWLFSNLIGALS